MRDVLLSVHILAMALWLGGSIMNGMINMKVMAQDSVEGSAVLAKAEAKTGMTFYMPMSIITLLSGVGLLVLVDGTPYGFGDPWVSFGFLTVIAAAILGPTKMQPLTDSMIVKFESGDLAGGKADGEQIGKWSMITTSLLVISTILMVVKP